ncbi:MAG: hypothetical protein MUO63_22415 [Desulfobulbaceae bacterium]|nr:hypothetical protein [Desulfobulbaceae bacterium]
MIHAAAGTEVKEKTSGVSPETPVPVRFITRGTYLVDLKLNSPVFSRGFGYSPYLPNETPLKGDPPGDDARYEEHLGLI